MSTARIEASHEQWRASLSDAFNGLVPDARDIEERASARGSLACVRLGEVAAFQVTGDPQTLRRTGQQTRKRPTDLLKVCIQRRGTATVQQGDRDIALGPGWLAIYDIDQPYALRLDGIDWCSDVVAFPRTALSIPDRLLHSLMSRAVPAAQGPGAVLSEFVSTAVRQRTGVVAGAAEHLGRAAVDLVAAALSGPDTLPNEPDPVRWQVISFIRSHLADPGLSHESVAAAHHMSSRTLHRLFADEQQSVSRLIRTMRLEAVRQDLTSERLAAQSITQIAARWGLHDMPHFTRVFRAAYGLRPSDLRNTRS
ncbi:MAG TPA: helix-turn-helix domain-containing protein [Pseudonocardiaceae bacterium]|jgi:AraC-like DNA-binding protein|nr:helix-turn-helix domain-containing protein [Pseudonocardiaceae bacterium]